MGICWGYRFVVLLVRCLWGLFLILLAEGKCCSLHVKNLLLRRTNGIFATIQQPDKIELNPDRDFNVRDLHIWISCLLCCESNRFRNIPNLNKTNRLVHHLCCWHVWRNVRSLGRQLLRFWGINDFRGSDWIFTLSQSREQELRRNKQAPEP